MTKGKYAARAANREAARDNELIAAQLDQIAALKQEIAGLRAELHDERAERGRIVIERAEELSATTIAEIRDEAMGERKLFWESNRKIAEWLLTYFHNNDNYPVAFIGEIMPHLVPDTAERNKMVNVIFAEYERENPHDDGRPADNRYLRRQSANNIKRAGQRLLHNDSGGDLLVRKKKLTEEQARKLGYKPTGW